MFAGNWLLLSVIADQKIGQAHMVYVRHDSDGKYAAGKEYVLPDGRRCTVRCTIPGDTYAGELLGRIYAMKIDGEGGVWHDLEWLLLNVRELGVEDGKAQAEHERTIKAARDKEVMKAVGAGIVALEQKVDAFRRDSEEREAAYKAKLKELNWTIYCLRHKSQPKVSKEVRRELGKAATQIYEGRRNKKNKK